MNDNTPFEPSANLANRGAWVLAFNQREAGSVLQAGGRAMLIPSELTAALSTLTGRVAARTMARLGAPKGLINYNGFRPYAMMEIIRRILMANVTHPIVLDPAAGYSPQLIWLANEIPYARFIELDRPDVVKDKLNRLRHFQLPTNYMMSPADLSKTTLADTLQGRKVDVIIAMGVYINADDYVAYLQYLRQFLTDTGKVISAFPYGPGTEEIKAHSLFFRHFAGELAGLVQSEADIYDRLEQANYKHIMTYHISELAKEMGKPETANIELLTVAQPNL